MENQPGQDPVTAERQPYGRSQANQSYQPQVIISVQEAGVVFFCLVLALPAVLVVLVVLVVLAFLVVLAAAGLVVSREAASVN